MSPTSSPTDYTEISEIPNQDPFGMFLYGIRADETRRQYTSKLKAFFDFIGLKETPEKQAAQFLREPVKDSDWALNTVIRFVNFHKGRVTKKEITELTLRNYYKPIKLFCEMNDIGLGWKKVAKGVPRARSASTDRAPTIEEIRTILNYPDRRIKPIVLTMISSGIRLGAGTIFGGEMLMPLAFIHQPIGGHTPALHQHNLALWVAFSAKPNRRLYYQSHVYHQKHVFWKCLLAAASNVYSFASSARSNA